uniref:agmatine deiminase family protein n=1 Tax=Alloprevotella sp. TaxID=1872471 RepID=UPI003FEDDE74
MGLFLNGNGGVPASLQIKRTLAPEWAVQSGVQLTWPHAGTDWAYMLPEVTECYLRLAFEIATRQTLLIVAPNTEEVRKLIEQRLPQRATDNIRYYPCATNDTWARDHGFLTVMTNDGPELLDFRFNGWGGKFEASLDNAINAHLVEGEQPMLHGKYVDCLDFELEGGSIEVDGLGTLLTTSECLLNPNRNAQLDKEHKETLLKERLGVDRVLWLDHGYLAGDDTDSHIDTLARLCPNNVIVYVKCTDPNDEHYTALQAMEQQLQSFTTAQGEPYTLLPLPMANAVYDAENGERLPATYANYLVMNDVVLYPTYAQPENDAEAANTLRRAFPNRDIIGVDCRALIRQHGSLHCVTMQYPKGVIR